MKNFLAYVFIISFAFAGLLLAGCLGGGQPTATPSASATAVVCTADAKVCPDGSYVSRVPPSCDFAACPSGTATTTPSPTASTPSPTPQAGNYSKEEVATAYWNALNTKDYAAAYGLVSREFKNEDSDAASLDAFTIRVKGDYPTGASFSDVHVNNADQREVLFMVGRNDTGNMRKRDFIMVFESGYWKIRIPYSTRGQYYNNQTNFTLNAVEVMLITERISNDFFVQIDPSLKASPISFEVLDQANKIFFASKSITLEGGGLPSGRGYSTFELRVGPADSLPAYSNTADLGDRRYSYEFPNSLRTEGGSARIICYAGQSNVAITFKMDRAMAQYYGAEDNPIKPVMVVLSRACPP